MPARLAHRWRLRPPLWPPPEIIAGFVREPVKAVPPAMAERLRPCRISLPAEVPGEAASRWTEGGEWLDIAIAAQGVEPHDLALELLICLGQALWAAAPGPERKTWLLLLEGEIEAGIRGEIDEDSLAAKQRLLAQPGSRRRLEAYAGASFASTAAEYVHCLWHDVTVRAGPEHLTPGALRRRLELLARWFPPGRGYRLFPRNG